MTEVEKWRHAKTVAIMVQEVCGYNRILKLWQSESTKERRIDVNHPFEWMAPTVYFVDGNSKYPPHHLKSEESKKANALLLPSFKYVIEHWKDMHKSIRIDIAEEANVEAFEVDHAYRVFGAARKEHMRKSHEATHSISNDLYCAFRHRDGLVLAFYRQGDGFGADEIEFDAENREVIKIRNHFRGLMYHEMLRSGIETYGWPTFPPALSYEDVIAKIKRIATAERG